MSHKTQNEQENNNFQNMVERKVSRRGIIKLSALAGAGIATAPLLAATTVANAATPNSPASAANFNLNFEALSPTTADDLVLPQGYSYNVIRSWGDYVVGGEKFGFNNDFIAYFPIDMLQGGNSSSDGLLWINHEYINPLFVSNRANNVNPTFEQLIEEKAAVGGSVIRVRKNANGAWEFVDDPTYNRRVTAWTLIDLDGPAAGSGEVFGATEVQGTLANCAGGHTPWGTALTAEENFQDYSPAADKGGYGWGAAAGKDRYFVDEHYGWIVEIDPFNKNRKPVKHTALGRFRHENATVGIGNSGKVVVYSGYDKADECVFKFISKGTYNPADREANMKLLSEGTLYAANFGAGRWEEVSVNNSKVTAKFKTQSAVLVNAGEAAVLAGGTRTDRPEDIKIHPGDKSIFISFTNNSTHSNYHGHITRIFENNNDHESLQFTWEVFASGGNQQRGSFFSSPDNLVFDSAHNLWVFCDVSSSVAGKGIYTKAGNNGIYVIPTTGANSGVAYRFGSGPVESEMTGPAFTPDFKTLFLSVQHPGEESASLDKPTSHWPGGGNSMPKPSVVAITGF